MNESGNCKQRRIKQNWFGRGWRKDRGRHRSLWWESPQCVTGQRTNGREHLHESEGGFGKIHLPFLNLEV